MKTLVGALLSLLGFAAQGQSGEILFCDPQHPNYANCQRQLEQQKRRGNAPQARMTPDQLRRDADDLARVERLISECRAARNNVRGSANAAGQSVGAQLTIPICSEAERSEKDRRRYEALRSEDPAMALRELDVQQAARQERRRSAQRAASKAREQDTRPSTSAASTKRCSSDYSCGIGYRCVKPPLEASGVCMREVDSFGTPTYGTPRSSSIDIKTKGQCDFDMDCPIGFACDARYKACVKR